MIISMEDYISKHPLHGRWKTLRKRGVLCAEWHATFKAFLAGVGERPDGYKKLVRDDMTKPYGPGNARWGKTPTREETLAYYRAWNKANPNARRKTRLRDEYGITHEQYEEMRAAQGNRCAICGNEERTMDNQRRGLRRQLAVDHDHKTGKVRELLCGHCNVMLGAAGEDPGRLFAAIQYLARHGKVRKVS